MIWSGHKPAAEGWYRFITVPADEHFYDGVWLDQVVEVYREADGELVVVVPPATTSARLRHWPDGLWSVAHQPESR